MQNNLDVLLIITDELGEDSFALVLVNRSKVVEIDENSVAEPTKLVLDGEG